MGFTPNQQQNNLNRQLSSTQIIFVSVCTLSAIDLTIYIFLVVNNVEDCMDAIFPLTALVGITSAFVSNIFKSDELFNFIEQIEFELTDRKYKSE